jgi:hypothetical protein
VSEPVSHRAMLSHSQVMAAALESQARRQLSTWWYFSGLGIALAAAMWGAGPLSFLLVQRMPFEWMFAVGIYLPTILMALFGLLGIFLVTWAYSHAVRRKLLREFTRAGIPLEIEGLYEILPEGLRLTTDRIQIFPRWEAVDTIERVGAGWALSADHLTFFLPDESFADEAAQRAFVASILTHMSEPARARSRTAVEFAA